MKHRASQFLSINTPPQAGCLFFCHRTGFTLIEILLVVVIIMIATAVAIPSFTRSFRGAKLRTAGRELVMASRYARSVAVLQQVQTSVLFDSELGTCEIVSISTGDESSKFLNDTSGEEAEQAPATVKSLLKKTFPDGVQITSVQSTDENAVQEIEGIFYVSYYPNGQCDAYEVVLTDDRGQSLRMDVDALSGKSTVTSEQ